MKRISYAELTENESLILCNNIVDLDLEPYNGEVDDEEEVYQFFLITDGFAEYLTYATDELVYYCPKLDLFVWGVTHFGTPWSGVYLDVKTVDEL